MTARFPAWLERAGAVGVVGIAVAVWALAPTYPNYDTYYHLVWGRELLAGVTPSFTAYAAPTQHPLYVAFAALLGLAGERADRLIVLACFLSHAALIVGAYRLGARVFGRWSGLLGAAFVASSASFLLYSARGYVDMPFLALVVWAGVRAAEREERSGGPMALLVLAGLLRPEGWILAGLWWGWTVRAASWRGRSWLTVGLLAAPVGWALVDWASTGDPLHSLHATSALADDLGREQGLGAVPGAFVSFVGATVRPPVFVLALIGGAVALRRPGAREARVVLALALAGVVTFVGTGALGLSILPRYLTVPSVAFCLLAGYALAGWERLDPREALRRRWRRASAAAAVLGLVGLALLAPSLGRVTEELRFLRATHAGLVAILDAPAVRAASPRCGPISLPTYRLVPDARWHLDAPRGAVVARSAQRPPTGVAVFLTSRKGLRRNGFADGTSPTTNVPDPGFGRIATAEGFGAYARCVAAPRR